MQQQELMYLLLFVKADFFAESYITCSGDSLYFQDYSYHNPISWQWNFEGASVNNSNFQNAFANYPLPGVYDVSLTASGDSINYLTELKSDKVIVMDYQGQSLPYFEGFENVNLVNPEWVIPTGNWTVTNETSYNGSYCLKLQNDGVEVGTKHFLESKTFDLSDSTKAYFSFKYAFAKKNSTNNDYLKSIASNDCGKTWSVRKILQYNQLATATNQINFVPNFSDWNEVSISSIVGPYCVQNFRFKFEYQSGGGNNLYIDNINISYQNSTSVKESNSNDVSLYPNPSSESLNISSSYEIKEIHIFDITGKKVLTKEYSPQKNIAVSIADLNSGFYTLLINNGQAQKTLSFIKN